MMRLTSSFFSAANAQAIARNVLPVPAGPTPKTTSCLAIVFRYSSCPAVLATTGGLRADVRILMLASDAKSGEAPSASVAARTA